MLNWFTGSLSRRLYLLIGVFALGMMGIVTFQLYDQRASLENFKRTELQSVVQSAISVIENFYERAQAGELTEAEAQQRALDTVRAMRYQGNEYFFIDSYDMVLLMHPTKPEKQGTDRSIETDGNGTLFIKQMIENVLANGSAYQEYLFTKPEGGLGEKVSYAQGFEPWGWVVASGILFTQVDTIFWQSALEGGVITLAIMLLIVGVGIVIARSIAKPMARLNTSMLKVADGDLDARIADTERADELGAMARAVEVFRENGLKVEQLTKAEALRIIEEKNARQKMMADLQQAFGDVVESAIDGDFSRRVSTDFADEELNALAGSVNSLVETVDRGVTETGLVLDSLAGADLTTRMTGEHRGAFAKLKSDVNAVAEKLSEIVLKLRTTSRGLKTATSEILTGANDLSERTTRQAAAIEETSAAIEQLLTTVRGNAEKAETAFGRSQAAASLANDGGAVMERATGAMAKITASSGKISNIIGMIDDIAFQTNLLALNASVEAARAGEAGKGFAVVAVEVRRLAQSAAQASSEVKVLIEQSGSEVGEGSKLVAEAAAKLADILAAVNENSTLMQGISEANREQSTAIGDVSTAIREMDEMTQHNAALVEETNAAIEQTEVQASELDVIVDIFTVEQAAAPMPQTRAARAAARPAPAPASAARSYLSEGNAALKADWSEF
ncbi:methyl-accepting chemotaxis protein [Devosia pacifica]|uniref:Methyl-accepting chemotaxis protein n=1 Tax=Devosia pacifica TaxID=1335967 RepID=A0A918S5E7_9HYPH|nr:methyl-accepting chemotaxis protein [Devosia pacifica]GHA25306.1 methyl-accepting chemotaxis protein [Devosia pacifica]